MTDNKFRTLSGVVGNVGLQSGKADEYVLIFPVCLADVFMLCKKKKRVCGNTSWMFGLPGLQWLFFFLSWSLWVWSKSPVLKTWTAHIFTLNSFLTTFSWSDYAAWLIPSWSLLLFYFCILLGFVSVDSEEVTWMITGRLVWAFCVFFPSMFSLWNRAKQTIKMADPALLLTVTVS